MSLQVLVALRRPFVIVERHTGANDVEHRRTFMAECRLHQSDHLFRIASERARNEVAAQFDGHSADIDCRKVIGNAPFGLGSEVGGSRELALRQSIHAVVFDNVDHPDIPA